MILHFSGVWVVKVIDAVDGRGVASQEVFVVTRLRDQDDVFVIKLERLTPLAGAKSLWNLIRRNYILYILVCRDPFEVKHVVFPKVVHIQLEELLETPVTLVFHV